MAQGFGSDIPPAINQTAKKYIRGMMKGKHRWSRLYGNRAREVMHLTANKMATQEQIKMGPTHNEIFSEAGDYWHPDPKKDAQISGAGNKSRAREDKGSTTATKEDPKKLRPGESYMDYAKRRGGYSVTKKKEGIRDKIKRKLGLRNSFEMSGGENISEDEYRRMLARERRAERDTEKEFRTKSGIGAKKKGAKLSTTKKSATAGSDYANSQMGSIAAHDKVTKGKHTIGNPFSEAKEDPCWKGYTQVGMKMKNGKEVPNCVPSKGVEKAKGYKKESADLKTFKQFCESAAWQRKEGKHPAAD